MLFRAPHFPATRLAALESARAFAPQMGTDYSGQRNLVLPDHPHVSKLAASLRVRLISEYEVAQIALDHHKNLGRCEKFVQEIYWRSYWRSWLEVRPTVWDHYLQTLETARHNLSAAQRKRIRAIESGDTGIEAMDNFVQELLETGYMHNHARMWFAAFWIHTENLPYELGANFFERHLICACPASNTLSWRWVAGLHTSGKSYLARRSNLEKYCSPEYLGEKGLYLLEKPHAVPVEVENLPEPKIPEFQLDLPKTKGKVGLWISEDDLVPETSLLNHLPVDTIATSLVEAPEKSETSNGLRQKFRREALADTTTRAGQVWNAPVANLEVKKGNQLATHLKQWAKENQLDSVVALKPFVGPTHDILPVLKQNLHDTGIDLHLLRRVEDARVLSSAHAGFFRFWSEVQRAST